MIVPTIDARGPAPDSGSSSEYHPGDSDYENDDNDDAIIGRGECFTL